MAHPMFERHRELLEAAVAATESRGHWSPYPENPRDYGEQGLEDGRSALEAYRGAQFYLDQPGVAGRAGAEESPYGLQLQVSYPQCSPNALIVAAKAAMSPWAKAGADTRAGVCMEILARLNAGSMEIAHAVMHTTGQPFTMAFQEGGPHAQERGLEAVALAYGEMKRIPETARWEKPQGKNPPLRMEKTYHLVPRGIGLVIGCATSPTWNSYPGLFASLVTGNPVIVKPHHSAILPLAITVATARQTLKEAGFDPSLVSLLVDEPNAPVTRDAALRQDVKIIDYAGGSEFGEWLEEHARQAVLYTQKSGASAAIIDSTDDYKGMLRNIAFSISSYSGQTIAKPQNIYISREGVRTPEGVVSVEQFGRDLGFVVGKLIEDPARVAEILGAIQSPASLARLEAVRGQGEVLRDSSALAHPQWPAARVHSPMLLKVLMRDEQIFAPECFGPVSFVIETPSTPVALATAERLMRERGAHALSVYSTNPVVLQLAEDAALRAGVALSINLVGGVLMNQSAAFSDFHGTGANPSGTASLTNAAFVANRFVVVQSRRHL